MNPEICPTPTQVAWARPEKTTFSPKDETHIWLINLQGKKKLPWEEMWELLDPAEQARAKRFRRHEDRGRFICTYACLKKLLGQYLHYPAEKISFQRTTYGKPFFEHEPTISFNISHDRECILIAIHPKGYASLGIDVSFVSPGYDYLQVAANFYHSAENNRLSAWGDSPTFFRFWTAKEAVAKSQGTGLTDEISSMDVSSILDLSNRTRINWKSQMFELMTFQPLPNYVASLATNQRLGRVRFFRL